VAEKRLRVAIDAHMVGGRETGNETYVKGLIEGLRDARGTVDVQVLAAGDPWTAATPNVSFRRLATANPFVRLGVELPLRSLGRAFDVLHVTYTSPIWSAVPVVVTVHDICFTTNPEWFSPRDLRVLNAVVPFSVRRAAHVITVSEDVRRRILERYSIPESRITTIPNGPGAGAQPVAREDARRELAAAGLERTRPFLLAVGNLQPRKNLVRLLEAFGRIVQDRRHDVDLLVVGPRRYRAQEVVDAAARVHDRVAFTGYLSDRLLAAAYTCGVAFVFPSLYEGFGLPAIEAMAHGTPVASSNAGALPEVCGDAALLFDPYSVEAIAAALDRLLGDEELRARLGQAGLARAKLFDWTTSARRTVDVYRSVAAQSSR
jgi:glycosyltransferase involved in cell wall biosynthesis